MGLARTEKRGGRHLLPEDNRSAACKWIPEKKEKREKRALRSNLGTSSGSVAAGSERKPVSLAGEAQQPHAKEHRWERA